MKRCRQAFNLILAGLWVILAWGCRNPDPATASLRQKGKEVSTLRLHLETNADGTDRVQTVKVLRSQPITLTVDRVAVLHEGDVKEATVVDAMGGFALKVQFNDRGRRIMEMTTVANKGQRWAIHSQFGDSRWLAAPLITQNVTNGVLVFTPDATREESDRIVRGLNRVAAEAAKKNQW